MEDHASTAEASESSSLPSWMRYMPQPPWKHSTGLNLQLQRDDSDSDNEKKESERVKECVSGGKPPALTDNSQSSCGESSGARGQQGSEELKLASGKQRRKVVAKKKRKALSSNPFSTSHVVLAQLAEAKKEEEEDSTQSNSSSVSSKKRRRIYSETPNLDDTAALFSFCKFKK